jgi:hypothetical protein
MQLRPALLAVLAALPLRGAIPTWPSSLDDFEDIMYLQSGYRSRNLRDGVTPCSFSAFGAGRIAAAEWIRTAFHDMATANVVFGTGGLDGSINYETSRAENAGAAFNDTLDAMMPFYSARTSLADMLALALAAAVQSCGGPVVPVRGGRVDALAAGDFGVPLPQNDIGTFEDQFQRMGFSQTQMIQVTACGHAVGGVHASDNPGIVPPGSTANNYKLFDSDASVAFDQKVVSEYVAGVSQDALVSGPAVAIKQDSDLRIFASDQNATITAMATESAFDSVCSAVLQQMIEVVPAGVTLSDPVQPYDIKPSGLQLTLLDGASQLAFAGYIRVRTTVRPAAQIASVQLIFRDRDGGSECGASCNIATAVAGTAEGFADSFVVGAGAWTLRRRDADGP